MGLFGGSRTKPDQTYGGGYNPSDNTMSMSGGQQPAHPKFFDQGGTGRAMAGYFGDALLNLSGGKPVYAPAMQEHQKQQDELQRMMALAKYKAQNPDPTGTMQNVEAAGFKRGTPEYQAFMQKTILAPHYLTLGSPETGQTVIDANSPAQSAGPPPEAVAHLKSDPSLAGQFDEVFGPGSAARVMGAQ